MWPTARLRVRECPSTENGDIISMLETGEAVRVTGRVQGLQWYQVRLANGAEGYAFGKYLSFSPR